jgi:hypothetical protein
MRTAIVVSALVLVVFLAAIVGLEFAATANPESAVPLREAKNSISDIGRQAWEFGRPILQLIVVLFVISWFAKSTGIDLSKYDLYKGIDIRAFIAIFVIVSFCIASLGGITGAAGLKDITLAVVGFYFGSKTTEKQQELDRAGSSGGSPTSAPPPSAPGS